MITVLILAAAASPALGSPDPSYIRSHYPKAVQPLLLKEAAVDRECRGGLGSDPATDAACNRRDAIVKKLEARGWCWGSTDRNADDSQLIWLRCSEDRTR